MSLGMVSWGREVQAHLVLITCKSRTHMQHLRRDSGMVAVGSHITNPNGLYCRCFLIHMCMSVHVRVYYIQTCLLCVH